MTLQSVRVIISTEILLFYFWFRDLSQELVKAELLFVSVKSSLGDSKSVMTQCYSEFGSSVACVGDGCSSSPSVSQKFVKTEQDSRTRQC